MAMAAHSSTLAWKIPSTEEPGGLRYGVARSQTRLHFHFHALEKAMAAHSSVPAWRIPGPGEPAGLPFGVAQSRTRLKRPSNSSSSSNKTWSALFSFHLSLFSLIFHYFSLFFLF